ncbi:MAG: Gfo/Idh/MocA family protein [Verrucomicrobiales bacterium]
MEELRVGVVGVGHIGKNHARIYHELSQTRLCAIYDVNNILAEELAKKYHAVAAESLEQFSEMVEAASVATPTPYHYPIAKHLLESGVNVLVEKPITADPAQALELVDLAKSKNRVLQVGHVERYNPVMGALEAKLTQAKFIEAHRLSPYPERSTEIGVVLDLMIHDLEIILHLVQSPVKSIDAVGIPVLSKGEDIANARIRFENGCVANITASRISPERMRKIRVFQHDAYLSLDYQGQTGEMYRRLDGKIVRDKVVINKGEPLRLELESFLACVKGQREPVVTGQHGAAALALASEITRLIAQPSQ